MIRNILAATLLTCCLAAPAQSEIVDVSFNDPRGISWQGFVDTIEDTLTIESWDSGTGFWWTPTEDSLPLVWPAITSTEKLNDPGAPFDVPDNFSVSSIGDNFGFISPVPIDEMAWNEGQAPDIGYHVGWGADKNDAFTIVSYGHLHMDGLIHQVSNGAFSIGPNRPYEDVTVKIVPEPNLISFVLSAVVISFAQDRRFRSRKRES